MRSKWFEVLTGTLLVGLISIFSSCAPRQRNPSAASNMGPWLIPPAYHFVNSEAELTNRLAKVAGVVRFESVKADKADYTLVVVYPRGITPCFGSLVYEKMEPESWCLRSAFWFYHSRTGEIFAKPFGSSISIVHDNKTLFTVHSAAEQTRRGREAPSANN